MQKVSGSFRRRDFFEWGTPAANYDSGCGGTEPGCVVAQLSFARAGIEIWLIKGRLA